MSPRAAALLFAVLLPATALAWPVDGYIDVPAGGDTLVKFGALDGALVEDPSVAEVEVMADSGELLVTGKKPGRTLVQLFAQGRAAVWRVRVGGKPEEGGPRLAAATRACPDLKLTAARELSATLGTTACRDALLALFEQDDVVAKDLELTFEVKVLQAQLADLQRAVAAARAEVKLRYEGAGLILEGKLDEPARRRALLAIFKKAAGRVALNERLDITAAPDAGAPPKGTSP